ncbi:hypothetical protein GUJ93_ZPchr0010g8213 [Zizania palustris]|uniref:Uncharacterized protein n=1 Tax=Zizania palustris TaxID=103762 RepID=A0A8J5WAX1_ZIZPA|nr:hypothetical protein GUJ93_ZPchr0010g8213 [Zizania palustris]
MDGAGSNGGSSSGSRKGARKEIAARKKIVKPAHERRRAEVAAPAPAPERVEDMGIRSTPSDEMVRRLCNLQNSLRQIPPGTDTPTREWMMNLQNSIRQPPQIPATGASRSRASENAANKLASAIFVPPGSGSPHQNINMHNSLRLLQQQQPPPTTNPPAAGTDHSRVSMAYGHQGYRVTGGMNYGQFQQPTIISPPGGGAYDDEATSNLNPNIIVEQPTDEVKLPEEPAPHHRPGGVQQHINLESTTAGGDKEGGHKKKSVDEATSSKDNYNGSEELDLELRL